MWLAHTDRKVTDPYLLPSKGSVSPISQTLIGKLDPCPLIRLSILSFFVYFPFNFCMPSSITKGVNFHPNIFLVNKSSGPLPTVPKIHRQIFGTVANGPEDSLTNLRDHCQWSRRFVDPKDVWLQIDPFCNGSGHVKIKEKIDKKA